MDRYRLEKQIEIALWETVETPSYTPKAGGNAGFGESAHKFTLGDNLSRDDGGVLYRCIDTERNFVVAFFLNGRTYQY